MPGGTPINATVSQRERQYLMKRLASLQTERQSFMSHWRSLSDYFLGHRGRFMVEDRNKGARRDFKLHNNTSKRARRTLASGMMSGVTSPARPWFKLQTLDPDLSEFPPVKQYLTDVERLMLVVFAQSNLYDTLHAAYSELGTFGNAPVMCVEDFDNVVRFEIATCGSYYLGANDKHLIDTVYREFDMQADVMAKRFGFENLSPNTQRLIEQGNGQKWVTVVHAIEPNEDYVKDSPFAREFPYASIYFEKSDQRKGAEGVLRFAGYQEFPYMVPRWDVTGEDVYATHSPGMDALGDTKELQYWEKQNSKALEKQVDPPMVGDGSVIDRDTASLFPGDVTWAKGASSGRSPFMPAYEIRPDYAAVENKIQRIEHRISQAFYEDLFLMLAEIDRAQITATEIAERKEEKLLMLGPVLERLNNELLDPLIDRTYNIMARAGILPEAPPDISGQELQVEYISVLAQAQKAVSTQSMERFGLYVRGLAELNPEVLDKVDFDESVEQYADAIGVSPKILRQQEDVEEIRAQRQQQMAAAQAAEQANSVADTAQKLGDSELDDGRTGLQVVSDSLGIT